MGDVAAKVSISAILRGIGVERIYECDPLNLNEAVDTVKEAAQGSGRARGDFPLPLYCGFQTRKML